MVSILVFPREGGFSVIAASTFCLSTHFDRTFPTFNIDFLREGPLNFHLASKNVLFLLNERDSLRKAGKREVRFGDVYQSAHRVPKSSEEVSGFD